MTRIYHPTLADVSYEVPEQDVESWQAMGWKIEPTPEPASAPVFVGENGPEIVYPPDPRPAKG